MKNRLTFLLIFTSAISFAQTGHMLQGIGAVNMSMGGASTAQPADINGALMWNPASISSFDGKILSANIGLFISSPKLSSSLPAGAIPSTPALKGTSESTVGAAPVPSLAMVWGKKESKHSFGVSAFAISGLGVAFSQEINNPLNPAFDPTKSSNPITYPQAAGGFGNIESKYALFQTSFTYSYKLSENLSIGIQPNFNYHTMKLFPNPFASPTAKGYANGDGASAFGYGAQLGIFYDSKKGIKLGLSYKTKQKFSDVEFTNASLDGSEAPPNTFSLDFPSVVSVGMGYSKNNIDFALDFRQIFYENTNGFSKSAWTSTGSVTALGFKNVSVVCAGVQFKGVAKLPIRLGYTYSSSHLDPQLPFFAASAPLDIKHGIQAGVGYLLSDRVTINGVFHFGTSAGTAKGQLMSPLAVTAANPYGAIPGTEISFNSTTKMVMIGVNYSFK
jgi:long-chain fatty acid transport protein